MGGNEKRIKRIATRLAVFVFLGLVFLSGFHNFSIAAPTVDLTARVSSSTGDDYSNGQHSVRFVLYTTDRSITDPYPSNADQNQRVWTETQTVEIQDGFMKVLLGQSVPFPSNLNVAQNDYYLGIQIDQDSEMVPRKKLMNATSAISALNSVNAIEAENSQSVMGATTGKNAGDIPLLISGGVIDPNMLPNITSLGTISKGTWNGAVIANGYIIKNLSGKTYNGLEIKENADGFSLIGGNQTLNVVGSNVILNQDLSTSATPTFAGIHITSGLAIDEINSDLTVAGDIVPAEDNRYNLGLSSLRWKNLNLAGNLRLAGNVVPEENNQSIGTISNRFNYGYFDNLDVGNITVGGVDISGTHSNILSINSDNATADLEDSFISFERGSLMPNALIGWNAANDRFDFNFSVNVSGTVVANGQLISTLSSGTAPLVVSSNTLVSNLNADLVDGFHLNQSVLTDSSPTFVTVNTGQGDYELYAMDQNVLTTSSPTFAGMTLTGFSGVLKANAGVVAGNATTTDLPEGTNQYFTDARSRAAISETATGLDYNNTTGVLSQTAGYVIPTTTEEADWNAAYSYRLTGVTDNATGVDLSLASNNLTLAITAGYVIPTTTEESTWNSAYANRILSASAPLYISNNGIYISQANSSTDGYLSSIDWNTFNNKQTDYTNLTSIGSLTNGTGYLYNNGSGTFSYSTTGLISSLTAGYIPYATSATALGSSSLYYTSGKVGVGTTNPTALLEVNGQTKTTTFQMINGATAGYFLTSDASGNAIWADISASGGAWTLSGTDLYPDSMTFNVGIGTTSPITALDVNGVITATGGNSTNWNSGYTYRLTGVTDSATGLDASLAANNLTFSLTTGYVIPTTIEESNWNSAYANRITSASAPIYISGNGIYISQANTATNGYLSSTDWNTFNGKQAAYTNLTNIGSLANGTGWLYNNGSGTFSYSTPTGLLSGLTSGYVPYATSATGLGNSVMYYKSGYIGIGTTNPTGLFQIGVGATTPLFVSAATGNVGIGTTNPGSYRLNVNGSVYSTGVINASSLSVTSVATNSLSRSNAGTLTISGASTGGTGYDVILKGGDGSDYGSGVVKIYGGNDAFSGINGSVAIYKSDGTTKQIEVNDTGLGFFGVSPVARQASTVDIKDALTNYGLLQGTSATPLDLDGGQLSAGNGYFSGNVGIGTNNSLAKLDVNGGVYVRANGSTTADGFVIGSSGSTAYQGGAFFTNNLNFINGAAGTYAYKFSASNTNNFSGTRLRIGVVDASAPNTYLTDDLYLNNGMVGIGTTVVNSRKLYIYLKETNPTIGVGSEVGFYPNLTADSANEYYGTMTNNRPSIATGVTVSGSMYGNYTLALRNYNGTSSDDGGALAFLVGQRISYGNYNYNAATSPITTKAVGLLIHPYYTTGTITSMYDLYLDNADTGAIVTNRWGIFQKNNADNYFAGKIGVGITSPNYNLDVAGQINASTGFCVAGSCVTNLVGGTGTADYISKWSSNNMLANSVIYDNGTNIGIGMTNPGGFSERLGVFGAIRTSNGSTANLTFSANAGTFASIEAFNGDNTAKLPIALNPYGGNVGIGTVSANGLLDVRGNIVLGATSDGSLDNQQMLISDGSGASLRIVSPSAIILKTAGTSGSKFSFSPSPIACEEGSVFCVTSVGHVMATGYRATQGVPNYADSSNNGYSFKDDGDTGMFSSGTGVANGTVAFFSNNTEVMRINGANQGVGIGTTSPMATFQVNTDIQYDGILLNNDTNNVAQMTGFGANNDNGGVAFYNEGAKKVQIIASGNSFLNGGNIGIGTTNPVNKLSVVGGNITTDSKLLIGSDAAYYGGGTVTPSLQVNSASTNGGSSIMGANWASDSLSPILYLVKAKSGSLGTHALVSDGDTTGSIYFGGSDGNEFINTAKIVSVVSGTPANDSMPGYLAFFTNAGSGAANERMRILSNGNIGIGTTSPVNKLDVAGNFYTSGFAFLGATTAQTNINNPYTGSYSFNPRLQLTGASADASSIAQISYQSDVAGPNVMLAHARGNIVGSQTVLQTNDELGRITFEGSDGTNFLQGAVIRSLIESAPATGDLPSNLIFYTRSSGGSTISERMRITSVGNIGIGTATPGAKLQIGDSSSDKWKYLFTGTSGSSYGTTFNMNDTGLYIGHNSGSRSINFQTNDTEKMTIAGGGNVGIGTTAPTAQLHTTGTVRFANFGAGTVSTDANGNISVSSDERLKDIAETFDRGLDDLIEINPISYYWKKSSGLDTKNLYTGFSAQNVQASVPEAIGIDNRGYLTLSDRPILATAVNAIKELNLRHEAASLQLGNLNLKTDQNLADVENLNLSVEEKITVLGGNLDRLDERLSQTEFQLSTLQTEQKSDANQIAQLSVTIDSLNQVSASLITQLSDQEKRLQLLELLVSGSSQTNSIQTALQKWVNQLSSSESAGKIAFAVDGDLKVRELQAEQVNTLGVSTSVLEMNSQTSGKNTISQGKTNVTIETQEANKTAKILITPVGDTNNQILFINEDDIIDGKSFTVNIKESVQQDIKFNWMIVK